MIRRARLEDALAIQRIAVERTVSRDSPVSGLVEYPIRSVEWYADKIKSPYFLVDEDEGNICGFSSAYDSYFLLEGGRFADDEIVTWLLNKLDEFVYWDQLVVDKGWEKKGVGMKLAERCLSSTKSHKLVGVVGHKPIFNESSVRLISKLGLSLEEYMTAYGGLVFGVYWRR
ncbi:MAG TPA: GNAT family N-acetyltransferase [Candidatus Nanoarchaeia archaeon]|nr:GNAT family N-acetyltransferase [Candidatus Nanoarchaeia archaeon]